MGDLSSQQEGWHPRRVLLVDRSGNHITNDHGGVVTVTYLHHLLHGGLLFNVTNGVELDDTEVYEYLIQTNSVPVHFLFSVEGSGEANLTIYEGTTFSGAGTAVTPINVNRTSALTMDSTITHTPTLTTDEALIAMHHFGAGKKIGGGATSSSEFILASDEDYLFRITSEADNNDIDIELLMYEQEV